jgi:hypothetical protein
VAEHYKLAGEAQRAHRWGEKAAVLAKAGGNAELMQFIQSKEL